MLDNIGVLQGISGKMGWLNQRQTIIAQNVANADTPKYVPHDLKTVDFDAVMTAAKNKPFVSPIATKANHIHNERTVAEGENKEQRTVYESAPDGQNAVILEEQLFKAQETSADYNLMTNLYRKNANMIKIAIGKA